MDPYTYTLRFATLMRIAASGNFGETFVLATSAPTFAGERDVMISANPQVPYDVVIATLDAMRRTENGDELFPRVSFGVAR